MKIFLTSQIITFFWMHKYGSREDKEALTVLQVVVVHQRSFDVRLLRLPTDFSSDRLNLFLETLHVYLKLPESHPRGRAPPGFYTAGRDFPHYHFHFLCGGEIWQESPQQEGFSVNKYCEITAALHSFTYHLVNIHGSTCRFLDFKMVLFNQTWNVLHQPPFTPVSVSRSVIHKIFC